MSGHELLLRWFIANYPLRNGTTDDYISSVVAVRFARRAQAQDER